MLWQRWINFSYNIIYNPFLFRMSENKSLIEKVNTLLQKIEQRFSTDTPPAGKTLEMGEAKLKDGTIVTYQGELNVGSVLNVVASGGEPTPAPNGDHELEDGTIVTVADGVVTDIKKAGEGDGEGESAEVIVNAKKVEEMQAEIASLREQLGKYADLANQFASLKEDATKQNETVQNLFEAVQLLSQTVEPETNPAPSKQSFSKMVNGEKTSKIEEIMAGAKRFKEQQN